MPSQKLDPFRPFLCAAVMLFFAVSAHAQGRSGGGPPGGRGGDRSPMGGGMGRPGSGNSSGSPAMPQPGDPNSPGNGNSSSTRGRSTQLGPIGRWWDDPSYARSIAIDSLQQKRMDAIFGANKGELLKRYSDLKHQEALLDKVAKSKGVTEAELDGQIDRVAQARSELQKANTHMLLQLRKELTPEQIDRLDTQR